MLQWEKLPEVMQTEPVREYYEILSKKKVSLFLKRAFDIVCSLLLLLLLLPVMLVLALWIKADSRGPVLFRQERVTRYGRRFRIFKFRTMIPNAESVGTQVTVGNDMRVTRAGRFLRKCRLDELPQLLNVFFGSMSFVGTRPEVVRYVERYTPEMYATLLLPAGVTSQASIRFKDEEKLLSGADNADDVYLEKVLPEKMKYNLESIRKFSFWREISTMFQTVFAVFFR